MRNHGLELKDITDVMQAITKHEELASYFPQLDPNQRESLDLFWNRMLKFSRDGKYSDHLMFSEWKKVNVHIVQQTWGSTSGGWEGMGGAAMSTYYTTVIESIAGNAAFVFYGGKLAYVADMDEKFERFKAAGYKNLPGISEAKSQLTIFYKYSYR